MAGQEVGVDRKVRLNSSKAADDFTSPAFDLTAKA
jgi:hypothetical protein